MDNNQLLFYRERSILLSVLSKSHSSYIAFHDPEDQEWDKDWLNILVIKIAGQQCTWHIHDDDMQYFKHLKRAENYKWDGHTTAEKYEHLASIKASAFDAE